MFDEFFRNFKDLYVKILVKGMPKYVTPNNITFMSLLVGLLGVYLTFKNKLTIAFILFISSRILDGIDGALARDRKLQSDLGGHIDILADFIVIFLNIN